MSSNELTTIYRNAANIVALRLKNRPGVEKVLDDLGERVTSEVRDPLRNRRLILEPVMLSQRLRVPKDTVEAVVAELRRLNFVHMWVRATCPRVAESDDNTIVETDQADEFHSALSEPCGHCGQFHELTWANIQSFYAIHVDGKAERLNLSRFLISHKRLAGPIAEQPLSPSLFNRCCRRISAFFAERARKPVDPSPANAVAQQLELNRPNSDVQSPQKLGMQFIYAMFGWAVFTVIVFLACRYTCDVITTTVVTLIMVGAGIAGGYLALWFLFVVPFAQRTIAACGGGLIAYLVALSIDVNFKWVQGQPVELSGNYGDTNPTIAICAVVAFGLTALSMVACVAIQGWLSRP